MTREEFNEKITPVRAEINAMDKTIDELKVKRSLLYEKETELCQQMAESESGFKRGEIVEIKENYKDEPYDLIIDKVYYYAQYNDITLVGRKITKSGNPSKGGTKWLSVGRECTAAHKA